MGFNKVAERKQIKLRIGISGPSQSGKTWSALLIAQGLGGKIGLIDTEAGRGSLYAHVTEYYPDRLDAPYSPERYIEKINEAEKAGVDVLIIDSLSHAWNGSGGVLSMVDETPGKSKFTSGWKKASPEQNKLVEAITQSKMHIICTMRSKTEWVLDTDARGQQVPRKVGLEPVQRNGIEYEFTLFMSMDLGNIAWVNKDNTQLFTDQHIKPTVEMGEKLVEWINGGVDDKKRFLENIGAPIIEAIAKCENLKTLENTYKEAYKLHALDNMEGFEVIIKAKDARKDEIQNAIDEEWKAAQNVTMEPLIHKTTKYSNALVNKEEVA